MTFTAYVMYDLEVWAGSTAGMSTVVQAFKQSFEQLNAENSSVMNLGMGIGGQSLYFKHEVDRGSTDKIFLKKTPS